ncbi:hypothetical protein [Ereboglobus luteus]|uniref:Uncharacterized protein n=1 Tax=Ereboglobus luteus TaxID=1796921 RepID=A0A2U8E616_9BACT|nr:hypothetical protein [Ereboglobus luteus]AWI10307.1 hypothetical protein CKA38_14530 [Ereboglobus luteus]
MKIEKAMRLIGTFNLKLRLTNKQTNEYKYQYEKTQTGSLRVKKMGGRFKMNRRVSDWAAREGAARKRLDDEAISSWIHPGDVIDGVAQSQESDMDSRAHALEAMRRILAVVIPPPGCRDDNRWRAAFGRFMALVYIVAPEYTEGMTMRALATQLHVDERTLRLRMSAVREALDGSAREV